MTTPETVDVQAQLLAEAQQQSGELHAIKLGVWSIFVLLLLPLLIGVASLLAR